MDPQRHATLSARRRGGAPEDYYALHAFFDTTKELCSDNRHRLLHNLWGIRRVVIPLFGREIMTASGERVATKDVCEGDHVLADFSGKYLPTLADFTGAVEPVAGEEARFAEIAAAYDDGAVQELLRSPYSVTGHVASLLVTHNTWFLSEVLPRLHPTTRALGMPRGIPPSELFQRMSFELWMDNGVVAPPSAPKKITTRRSGDEHVRDS